MNKPKPCPFCGSNDITIQHSTEDREGVPANLLCMDCGAAGPWLYVRKVMLDAALEKDEFLVPLVALWNTRK